jgi:hypothetical protein
MSDDGDENYVLRIGQEPEKEYGYHHLEGKKNETYRG